MPIVPTPQQKKRQRMVDKAAEYQTSTYAREFVAPIFQRMIRAEAGARPGGETWAVKDGVLQLVTRWPGRCVCITCGKVGPWASGIGGMHTGHFLASRRNSILLVEDNVAPQCSSCNRYNGGRPQEFRVWMLHVRGEATVSRLEKLKTQSRTFTREELVDLRIQYDARLKAAIAAMG